MSPTPSPSDGSELIDPVVYERDGQPHEAWTQLRRSDPVHHFDPPGFGPFWAITRHADIREISRRPDTFGNAAGIVLLTAEQRAEGRVGELAQMRTIIEMDPPEHRDFRRVGSPWFTPNGMKRIDAAIDQAARELVDGLASSGGEGECDFATDVAARHPLRILSTILGVPRDQEDDILRLTNQLFAADDPELQRAADRQQAMRDLGAELYGIFAKIIDDRRAAPRDDLASLLANGRVNGELMGPMETFGYYLITFTAGHDTTKNSIVGGMRALVENPGELEKLRRDPDLVVPEVEEIVRWTTPVNYMKRTALCDVEVAGHAIREGEELLLFYASANRDEDVFEEPFRFRIDRDPNPHLGFGHGEHFCLGANLARRSQRALFRELATRLEHVELAGEPEHIRSNFVVGLKHLPLRYRIAVGA